MDHFPPRKILVPIDFSECSMTALRTAKLFGGTWNSTLEMVHVNEYMLAALGRGPSASVLQGPLEEYYRGLESRMRDLARDYPRADVRVLEGYAKEVLTGLAAAETADLVVMGTRGLGGARHFFLGSVAEAVVRASRVPVLTVHARSPLVWPTRILAPLNFTAYSDRALLYARELAYAFGAALGALYVAEGKSVPVGVSDRLREHVKDVLGEPWAEKAERIADAGDPAERVLETVEANRFDLVVVAAHRKPFWKDLTLGMTAERVLRHSPVPVLSIPSSKVLMREEEDRRLERRIIESLPR